MKTHKQKNNQLFKIVFADYSDGRFFDTLQGYRYVRIVWYLYLRIHRVGGHYST